MWQRFEQWLDRRQAAAAEAAPVDSRHRIRGLVAAFAVLLSIVFLRIIVLQWRDGAAYRTLAAQRLEKVRSIAGHRGRILARDGTVLAYDERRPAIAVHYRYLEEPPNSRWFRQQARARVPAAAPDRAARVIAEQSRLREYRERLLPRLAALCGRDPAELESEAQRVRRRVAAIGDAVRARRLERALAERAGQDQRLGWLRARLAAALPAAWVAVLLPSDAPRREAPLVLAEEHDFHVVVPDVTLEVVAEIEGRLDAYPGVRIVDQARRVYPAGQLAANILGHVGPPAADASEATSATSAAGTGSVGRMGLELQFESLLRGAPGRVVELTDHGGNTVGSFRSADPLAGRDLVLSIDPALQHAAEAALDAELAAAEQLDGQAPPATGGAIVVMDVYGGGLLAAASAPRFDPNALASGPPGAIAQVLHDARHPLFDRVTRMAIPPGSVFKTVTAAALLAQSEFDPLEPFYCQGFLRQPDRQRCLIFRRFGVGHGETTLADALARSCNVYFFHMAERLGSARLIDWAARLGLGERTGVDLANESPGLLPTPATIRDLRGTSWTTADTQALAIGQGALLTTPLQIARLMAAIANGGRLVTPHVVTGLGLPEGHPALPQATADELPRLAPQRPVEGITSENLGLFRHALRRVVADPLGTAYDAAGGSSIAIAGKTGTAEAGGGRPDHAWFAAYAPAEAPRVAVVVVLEHAGARSDAAVRIARQLLARMERAGQLGRPVPLDVLTRANDPAGEP